LQGQNLNVHHVNNVDKVIALPQVRRRHQLTKRAQIPGRLGVNAGRYPHLPTFPLNPGNLVAGHLIRVWFGGGGDASPDENLHGKIGLATLRPLGVTLAK